MLEKVDLSSVKRIMRDVKKGRIRVSTLLRLEKPTPLAYHILAKYSEIPELMAPERVLLTNIERMKKTVLARKPSLLCLSCGNYSEEKRIRELPEKLSCEKCGKGLLAHLRLDQDPRMIRGVLEKRLEGKELTPEELDQLAHARRTADLILSYGKRAVVAFQVKGIGPETAFRILGKMHPNEDDFYLDLLQAKIQYLRTKPFWEKEKALKLK